MASGRPRAPLLMCVQPHPLLHPHSPPPAPNQPHPHLHPPPPSATPTSTSTPTHNLTLTPAPPPSPTHTATPTHTLTRPPPPSPTHTPRTRAGCSGRSCSSLTSVSSASRLIGRSRGGCLRQGGFGGLHRCPVGSPRPSRPSRLLLDSCSSEEEKLTESLAQLWGRRVEVGWG